MECIPINISLNTSSLATGNYTEYVTATDPNAIDSPQQISVNVVVANVSNSITLYVAPNGGTASSNVYPQSPVVGLASTQSGGNWLSFTTPTTGQTGFGAPYAITATSQPGQAPGTYTGSVQITGSTYQADNTTVNVTLNVTTSPIIQVNNTQIVLDGAASGFPVTRTVNFTNVGQGTLSVGTATASATTLNFLSAAVTSANTLTITADPTHLSAGTYTGTITITSNAANNAQVMIPVEFSVSPAGQPTISQGGIVNIANFQSGPVAIGDIVSIFGDQFTTLGNSAFSVNPGPPPLATTLGNVQVLVNGVPAPLYYVSRQQINFQMPYTASTSQISTVQVVSSSGVSGNIRSVQAATASPHVLVWAPSQVMGGYAIIMNSDGTISLPSGDTITGFSARQSKPGDVITIYATGLGQTTPFASSGAPASSDPIMSTGPVTVTFGTGTSQVTAQSSFAGLTPNFVGLYQVNATIPANVPAGASIPVSITIGSTTSNVANISVQ